MERRPISPDPNDRGGHEDFQRTDKLPFRKVFEKAMREDESTRRGLFWIGFGATATATGVITGEHDVAYTGIVVTVLGGRELVDGILSSRKK